MSILTDSSIKKRLNMDFVIHPFDERNCLTPLGYDLRIGYAVNLFCDPEPLPISGETTIVIPPRTSAFIITEEYVWLSARLVGTLHARGSLAARGLFLNSTTIDPNWSGQMSFLVYNVSDKSIELDRHSKFVTMILHQTLEPTQSPPGSNPIQVVERYNQVYDKAFSESLVKHLAKKENQLIEREFKTLVQEAQVPSLAAILTNSAKSLWERFLLTFQRRFEAFASGVVLILAVAALVIGFSVQWYWTWLQKSLGFNDPYSPTILFAQIAIVISALSVISVLINRSRNS